ncbi:MAG: thiamine ABC transporter substrate-binding protein [Actinomycetota bacterium]|nr:thiamine ABC transporter substrate-binding protein [Actinomycetota bacterium]
MHPRNTLHHTRRRSSVIALVGVSTLALGACSTLGDDAPSTPDEVSSTVVLLTHDSFAVSDDVLADFEQSTGLTVRRRAPGDSGALVNQMVLSKDAPLGDAVYGIDNTFASRALDADILAPYASPAAGQDADRFAVDDTDRLSAIDYSDVCINADTEWFAEQELAVPRTLEDLADPAYEDLLVVTNPATSSPGLAFLMATVDAFGADGWSDYWAQLRDNGVKVVDGWSDAYFVDFSGSQGNGPRPLVLSYASSPPAEVRRGEASTQALLETCFRQVEYAGVIAGAQNPDGAQELIDFLLSQEFQEDVPGQMYVYPVSSQAALPPQWEKFAPLAEQPYELSTQEIDANREAWIQEWTDVVVR